jgi:hypothetical protein
MSTLKTAIPVLFLLAAFSGAANAQSATSSVRTTYCVQVKYEMWRSGASYWSTEFETSSLQQALMMESLFEFALESGTLCEILGCGSDWIIVDVRIRTKREFIQAAKPWYLQIPIFRRF